MSEGTFADFLLHPSLLQSIEWPDPLPIQSTAIPLLMEGKSVIMRAKTGSGKTGAFLLPTIHRLLTGAIKKAVILAPTRELASQLFNVARRLCHRLKDIRVCSCLNIGMDDVHVSNLIVSLPSHLRHIPGILDTVVVDEADLCVAMDASVVDFQCKQLVLASATLTDECINMYRKTVQQGVKFVRIMEKNSLPANLAQYWIDCSRSDLTEVGKDESKFLLLVSLLKLNILQPMPILIFSSSTIRSYRIRLVLEQFGISACSLNSQLPRESRQHTLDRFQKGFHDIIITTDNNDVSPRGLDFRPISFVVNFDLPSTLSGYVHRVGRTARLHRDGTALSLIGPEDLKMLDEIRHLNGGGKMKEFPFPASQVEGFRYRVKDAMRIAGDGAVKKARIKEIKAELLNSEKLKSYFNNHEKDYNLLCSHDGPLLNQRLSKRFVHVPSYIVPSSMARPTKRRPRQIRRTNWQDKKANPLRSLTRSARILRERHQGKKQ